MKIGATVVMGPSNKKVRGPRPPAHGSDADASNKISQYSNRLTRACKIVAAFILFIAINAAIYCIAAFISFHEANERRLRLTANPSIDGRHVSSMLKLTAQPDSAGYVLVS